MPRFLMITIILLALSLAVDAGTDDSKDTENGLDKKRLAYEQEPKLKDNILTNSVVVNENDETSQDKKKAGVIVNKRVTDEEDTDNSNKVVKTQSKKKRPAGNSKSDSRKKIKRFLPRRYFRRKQRRWNNSFAVKEIIKKINAHNQKGKGSPLSTKYLRKRIFKPRVWRKFKGKKRFPKYRRRQNFKRKQKQLRKKPKKSPRMLKRPGGRNQTKRKIVKGLKLGTNVKMSSKQRKMKTPKKVNMAQQQKKLMKFGKRTGGKKTKTVDRKKNMKRIGKGAVPMKSQNNMASRINRLARFKGRPRAWKKRNKGNAKGIQGTPGKKSKVKGQTQIKASSQGRATRLSRLKGFKGRMRKLKKPKRERKVVQKLSSDKTKPITGQGKKENVLETNNNAI